MTIEAKIYEQNSMTYTKSLHQHDKNVTLIFTGIDLPETYEVHFSNQKERGISVACEGDNTGVLIPDELLSTGEYVYAWVCNMAGKDIDNTATLYTVVIPVIPRPIPVKGSSSSDGKIKYSVDEDEENVNFLNSMFNRAIDPNIEEDD